MTAHVREASKHTRQVTYRLQSKLPLTAGELLVWLEGLDRSLLDEPVLAFFDGSFHNQVSRVSIVLEEENI